VTRAPVVATETDASTPDAPGPATHANAAAPIGRAHHRHPAPSPFIFSPTIRRACRVGSVAVWCGVPTAYGVPRLSTVASMVAT
jgi:hypothetical protein